MTKFADQWEPNGPFGIVTDSNMSGGYRVVTEDADKTDIAVLPPERQKIGMLVYVAATGKTWRLVSKGSRAPGTDSYTTLPVFEDASGGVGNPIGGTPGSVLYIDSAGLLAEDNSAFSYDAATNRLSVGSLNATDLAGVTGVIETSLTPKASGGAALGSVSLPWSGVYANNVEAAQIRRPLGSTTSDVGASGARFRGAWFESGNFSTGLVANGAITFGATVATNGATKDIGTGANAATRWNVYANTLDILGTTIATGLLNADGGVGRSTNGTLTIGNDASVTGISIGTTSATGGVAIGSATNNVTVPGTLTIGVSAVPDANGGAALGAGGTRFSSLFVQTANVSSAIQANSTSVSIGSSSSKFGTVFATRVETDVVLGDTIALSNRVSRDASGAINAATDSYVVLTAGTNNLRFVAGANVGQLLVVELPAYSAPLIDSPVASGDGFAAHKLRGPVSNTQDGYTLTVIWTGTRWLEVARNF